MVAGILLSSGYMSLSCYSQTDLISLTLDNPTSSLSDENQFTWVTVFVVWVTVYLLCWSLCICCVGHCVFVVWVTVYLLCGSLCICCMGNCVFVTDNLTVTLV